MLRQGVERPVTGAMLQTRRNIVQEMVVTLHAVKPARPARAELAVRPIVTVVYPT